MVSDRDEEKAVGLNAVDQVVGKVADAAFARLIADHRTRSGMHSDLLKSSLDSIEEKLAEARNLPFVKISAFEQLAFREWVPSDAGHFSRARASAITSSDERGMTSPLAIS